MRTITYLLPILTYSLCLFFSTKAIAQLPDDFYDQLYLEGFNFPTGLTFDDNGRMYIWEKEGIIYLVDQDGNRFPSPLLDISEEVSNWNDHGLLGFTLDNGFLFNGHFYILYAVDLHHYKYFNTSTYHPDTTLTKYPTFGRVIRYTADPSSGFTTVIEGSRKILLGETIKDGIPLLYEFHGLGTLLMGEDGSLLLSCGDATSNAGPDTGGDEFGSMISLALEEEIITPDQDVGSYRAQYLGSLNGKILRIDAKTGNGLSSNPFFEVDNPRSAQSRTWALGFRNPYRMVLKPETGGHFPEEGKPGVLLVGDVGNGRWEELNVVEEGGQNFGWPVYEAVDWMWSFFIKDAPSNPMAPNPLFNNGSSCEKEYFNFRDLLLRPLKDDPNPSVLNPCDQGQSIPETLFPMLETAPAIAWSNQRWNPPTRAITPGFDEHGILSKNILVTDPESPVKSELFDGFSSLAGLFYTGDTYPEEYLNKYFGLDFSGWIKVFDFDEDNHLLSIAPFHSDCKDIIHLAQNPLDGFLYYSNVNGEIHKISYGGNPPPVPIIKADKFFGTSPLTVTFDGSDSYDPNSDDLTFIWDFGDGITSEGVAPQHIFSAASNAPESFTVALTVIDNLGASKTVERIVSLNNSPPQIAITSFKDGDKYPINSTSLLRLEADVFDSEHPLESLTFSWQTFLHHNSHFHPEPVNHAAKTHTFISPLGCEEETYWFRIELTVSDPMGLSTKVSQQIFPDCTQPFLNAIELVGNSQVSKNELQWSVDKVEDVDYFEIHRSANFTDFDLIGQVASNGAFQYAYEDPNPLAGANIYRIKAYAKDRSFLYSNLATVNYLPFALDFSIYPNPAKEFFTLLIKEPTHTNIEFELFNAAGVRLLNQKWSITPGQSFNKEIPISILSSGIYYYRILDGQEEKVGSLMIAK